MPNWLRKIAIRASACGCMLSVAVFAGYLSWAGQWHPEQNFVQKLSHPKVAMTSFFWVSAVISMFIFGTIATQINSRFSGIILAVFAWLFLSPLLSYATPFTARTCFSPFAGDYHCGSRDLYYKSFVMQTSLGFPLLLGFLLKNNFLKR